MLYTIAYINWICINSTQFFLFSDFSMYNKNKLESDYSAKKCDQYWIYCWTEKFSQFQFILH